jgi:hypothetical protein
MNGTPRWQRYGELERMYDGPIPPERLSAIDRVEQDVVSIAQLNVKCHRAMLLNKTGRIARWLHRFRAGHFTYGQTNRDMMRLAAGVTCDLLFLACQYLETLANLKAAEASQRLRMAAE